MQLVTLRAGRQLASATVVTTWLTYGCGDSGQIRVYQDAAFVDTNSGSIDADDGSNDADRIEGCAVPEPAECELNRGDSGCCAEGQRCVPALGGDNRCEPAGALLDGQACGTGSSDSCGEGLLCAESEGQALTCLRPCDEDSAPCPTGYACDGSLPLVGRTLAICTASP